MHRQRDRDYLHQTEVLQILRAHPLRRLVALTLGSLDPVAVVLRVLVMSRVILRLGHIVSTSVVSLLCMGSWLDCLFVQVVVRS